MNHLKFPAIRNFFDCQQVYYQERRTYPNFCKVFQNTVIQSQTFQTQNFSKGVDVKKLKNTIAPSRFATQENVYAIIGNIGQPTLKSGIDIAPDRLDKRNKHSPLRYANLYSKIYVF